MYDAHPRHNHDGRVAFVLTGFMDAVSPKLMAGTLGKTLRLFFLYVCVFLLGRDFPMTSLVTIFAGRDFPMTILVTIFSLVTFLCLSS